MGDKTSTTETVQELSEEQKHMLNLATPAVENVVNNPPKIYPGSAVADFDPLQTAGQNAAVNAAAGPISDMIGSAAQGHEYLQSTAIPTGTGGLGSLALGGVNAGPTRDWLLSGATLDPNTNPYLRETASAAIRPLEDNLMSNILPGIRRGAQTAGQVGSSRQGIAEGLAIRDFTDKAGDVSAGIYSQGYGQGLDAMGGALGDTLKSAGDASASLLGEGTRSLFATPDLAGLALMPSQILSAVGGQKQMMNQAQLTEEANNYMTEQLMPFMIAQDVANLAFGIPNGKTTGTATMPGPSPIEILLGIGSMAAGFF